MNARSDAARILFVYDSEMFRQAIVRSMSDCEDMTVVANVGTVKGARHLLEHVEVDAVVTGVDLPDGSGLDLCNVIKSTHPDIKVIVLSPTDDEETFLTAARICSDGYVLKSSPYDRFLRIMRSVLEGNCTYDPILCSLVVRKLVSGQSLAKEPVQAQFDAAGLSSREREVVEMISTGMTNKEIANELGISISTTKTHVSRIFKELDISSRGELLPRFINLGTNIPEV